MREIFTGLKASEKPLQLKPVWLVALQSAADGQMGNRMLTREEFEAGIDKILKWAAQEAKKQIKEARRRKKAK